VEALAHTGPPATAHGPATAPGSGRWPASAPATPSTATATTPTAAQPPQTPTPPLARGLAPVRPHPGHRRRGLGPPRGRRPFLSTDSARTPCRPFEGRHGGGLLAVSVFRAQDRRGPREVFGMAFIMSSSTAEADHRPAHGRDPTEAWLATEPGEKRGTHRCV